MFNWRWRLFLRSTPLHPVRKASKPRKRLNLERLEDRTVMSVTWVVDATTDTGTGNLTNHTGDLPFCVAYASAGDNIEFDPSLNGQTINLNSEIQVSQNGLNILGETPSGDYLNITINGQANTRLFEILGGASATINFLTLTGGYSGGNGGAVLVDPNASLSAYSDTFTNNSAGYNGGAIENDGTAYAYTCAFSDNTAGGNGGAIENTSSLTVYTPTTTPGYGYPTISNFVSNTATGMGGAIDSSDGGQGYLSVSYTDLYSNTASNGGAISTADPTSLDTDIFGDQGEGNSATSSGGNGGAVYALQNPNALYLTQLYASNCTFDYNTAAGTGSGGAIYTTMDTDVENSTFDSNSTVDGDGGAIDAVGSGSGSDSGSGSGSGSDSGSGSGSASGSESGSGSGSGGAFEVGALAGMFAPALQAPKLRSIQNDFLNNRANMGGNGGAVNSRMSTVISNTVFKNNSAFSAGGVGGSGGAVYCAAGAQGSLQDTDSDYFANSAIGGNGGAIYTSSNATIENDAFGTAGFAADGNGASAVGGIGGSGGAIYCAAGAQGSLQDTGSYYYENDAGGGNGGAIYTSNNATIIDDTFGSAGKADGNSASGLGGVGGNGGAIYCAAGTQGLLQDTGSYYYANAAFGGNGGAIYTSSNATINGDTFGFAGNAMDGNTSTAAGGVGGSGGAVYSDTGAGGLLKDTSSFYYANVATGGNGGAIATSNNTTINGDTFGSAGNAADGNSSSAVGGVGGSGGAVSSDGGSQDQLQDQLSTYSNNTAQSGGAIYTGNNATITLDTFDSNTANIYGGAVATFATTTIGGTLFQYNIAGKWGGAIENQGTLSIGAALGLGGPTRSTFLNNTAQTKDGGAIDSEAGTQTVIIGGVAVQVPLGSLSVFSTDFYGNAAIAGSGGAINTQDNTTLSDDKFGEAPPKVGNPGGPNTAVMGGGAVNATGGANGASTLNVSASDFAYNRVTGNGSFGGAINTSAITDVEQSSFENNQANNANGPANGGAVAYGITNQNNPPTGYAAKLTLNQDSFTFNWSTSNGGAVYTNVHVNAGTVTVLVTNSTFANNGLLRFTSGGGVDINHYTSGNGTASAIFTNDTFYQNEAATGAGLALDELTNDGTGTNTAELTSLTVFNNTASVQGGGLYVAAGASNGSVTVDNSILDGNNVTAANFPGPLDVTLVDNGVVRDLGYNLLGTSDDTVLGDEFDIFNNNPVLFAPLALNGALPGYQETLALGNNSPGYETGDPSLAGQIDERGRVRQTGKVSIGAMDPDAQ